MRWCVLELMVVAFAAAGCNASAAAAPPVWQRVVLVELFTSQECSACPPADAFVRELPAPSPPTCPVERT